MNEDEIERAAINEVWKKKSMLERLTKHVTVAALIATLVAGGGLLTTWIASLLPSVETGLDLSKMPRLVTEPEFAQVQQRMTQIETTLNTLLKTPPKTPVDLRLDSLAAQTLSVDGRLGKLEAAVMVSPESALAVPLLRKDLDNLRETYRRELETVSKQVDRIYDQTKWFIGLMVSMVVSLFGLAITIFLKSGKADK